MHLSSHFPEDQGSIEQESRWDSQKQKKRGEKSIVKNLGFVQSFNVYKLCSETCSSWHGQDQLYKSEKGYNSIHVYQQMEL